MLEKKFRKSANSEKSSRSALVIIDVQDFHGMLAKDAQEFGESLGKTIDLARTQKQSIIWASIAAQVHYLKPFQRSSDLEDMGFNEDRSNRRNRRIYEDFFKTFGPKRDEILYRKPFMSALIDKEDLHKLKDDEIYELLLQAGYYIEDNERHVPEDPKYFSAIEADDIDDILDELLSDESPSLAAYLTDKHIKYLTLVGAVSEYCVAETAASAIGKGFKCHIDAGHVLSWHYYTDNPRKGTLCWRNGMDEKMHAEKIAKCLEKFADDEHRSYGKKMRRKLVKMGAELRKIYKVDASEEYDNGLNPTAE